MVVAMRSPAYEVSEIFARALGALGARVHRVGGAADAADLIDGLVRSQCDPPGALWEPHGLLANLGLRRELSARGVGVVDVEAAGSRASDFRVGITAAELAIARSGTLLVGGEPGGWGLAAALPWMHIALVYDGARQRGYVNGEEIRSTFTPRPGPIDRRRHGGQPPRQPLGPDPVPSQRWERRGAAV